MNSKRNIFIRPIFFFSMMFLASIPISSQVAKYACVVTVHDSEIYRTDLAPNNVLPAKCGLDGSWDSGSSSCGGFPLDC